MVARVLGVLGLVATGLLLFVLFTSNPFERLLPAAENGRDLNPLLQDPGLVFHPPMLYMGYVGFSVAFAFAIAALLSGRLDAAWARWSRPWTTTAWIFLTLGIALGSWWAYYELGGAAGGSGTRGKRLVSNTSLSAAALYWLSWRIAQHLRAVGVAGAIVLLFIDPQVFCTTRTRSTRAPRA